MRSDEWIAWDEGENYSVYYEMRNVTSVLTTIEIDPPYRSIDIILQSSYGDVWMSVSIYNYWLGYDDLTGMNSLLVAIPFGLGSLYFATKEPKKDDNSNGAILS